MTPKEKAIELVNSCNNLAKDFTRGVSMNEFSKQFALLMASELIKQESKTDDYYELGSYWLSVKLEIEIL